MQANPLSFLSTTSSSGKSGTSSASSPASDAFARLLESQNQAAQARNSMGQRSAGSANNPSAQDRSSGTSQSQAASQASKSQDNKSQNKQAADSSSQSAHAESNTANRTDRASDASRSDAGSAASGASASRNDSSQQSAASSASANAGGADAQPAATPSATAGQAGNAALAQNSDAAAQPATLLNPLVLQIQQLTESSRLLADTVVALRTHPEQLPAQAEELVQALSGLSATDLAGVALPLTDAAADTTLDTAKLGDLAALAANAGAQAASQATANTAQLGEFSAPRASAALPTAIINPALLAGATPNIDPALTAAADLAQPGANASKLEAMPLPAMAAFEARNPLAATPDTRVSDAIQAAAAGLTPSAAPLATAGSTGLATLTGTVAAPLGAPQWGQHLSQQVVRLGTAGPDGMRHIELRLDPPDLGPVRISLSLAGEQASAIFVSPHAAVRQALEQALPQLQQAMADAGIQLGHTSVGEQDQPRDEAMAQGRNGGGQAGDESDDTATVAVRTTAPRGLIDTFA